MSRFNDTILICGNQGVEAIFLVTNFWEHLFTGKNAEESGKAESEQALAVVKIADKLPGLKHFIWSTLPGNAPGVSFPFSFFFFSLAIRLIYTKLSSQQPKRLAVPHCDYKALLDVTIKNSYPSLAAKTTFLYVGWYANNLVNFPSAKPFTTPFSYGAYFMLNPVPRTTILPSAGDASTNVGIVVKAVLEQRSKSLGKYVAVTVDNPTFEEVLGFWSKATGKQAAYLEVNGDDWNAAFGAPGKEMYLNYKLFEEGVVFEDNSPLSAKDLGIEGLVGTEEFLIGAKSALL